MAGMVQGQGIIHLTEAPYHPSTNGVAEHLVQTFKKSLRKLKLPPRGALQEFLMQYWRTPFLSGCSPSELLNGRQICTKLDAVVPSPAHVAQGIQAGGAMKSQQKEKKVVLRFPHQYHGPRRGKDPMADGCLPLSPRFMVQGVFMSGSVLWSASFPALPG